MTSGREKANISLELTRRQLKQEIYKAIADSDIAFQKYVAATSAAKCLETAFYAPQTRYEMGFIPYFEFLTEKTIS